MHDSEARALGRAAVVLVALSVLRWVTASSDGAGIAVPVGDAALMGAHIAATDSATEDGERRSRPLEEGERLDPNAASEAELDRLPGVGPATASALVAARDTLPFGRAEDLLRVRGVGPATLERIGPWLEISTVAPQARAPIAASARRDPSAAAVPWSGHDDRVDVNTADASDLQRLPGIGPALASRIIALRARTPFRSIEDLERVRGIGPATVAKLRGVVRVGRTP